MPPLPVPSGDAATPGYGERMVEQAGQSEAEASIRAGDLTQSYVGLAYGANRDGGVVYARIAAVHITDGEVTVVNDGVPAGDPRSVLTFLPDQQLHFVR